MREFFKGWQRKIGCLFLVMALAVTGMWMRSRVYGDFLRLTPLGSSNQFLASFQGSLKWINSTDTSGTISQAPRYRFSMEERYPDNESLMPIFGGGGQSPWTWHWQSSGFFVGETTMNPFVVSLVQIPYWFVAIPLTLLSALLIIWPGRKRA